MFRTIRWRIAWPFVLLILIAMTLLGVLISNFVRQIYLSNLEARLTSEARMVGDVLKPVLISADQKSDLDSTAKHWAEVLDARVTIIAMDGTVLGESHEDRETMDNHLSRPEVAAALKTGSGTSNRFSHTVGYQMMYTAVTVADDGKVLGIIRISIPLNQVEGKVRQLQGVLASTTLIVTVLAIIIGSFISIRISQPLRKLTRDIQQLSPGDNKDGIRPSKTDEIGQLSRAFNTMNLEIQNQISEIETERAKLAAVLEKMNDGVIIVDGKGIVQLINPAAEKMYSCSIGSAIGFPLIEVTQDHQPVELWQKCLDSIESQTARFDVSNNKIQVHATATLLGSILPDYTLLLFQDISRRVQTDAIRRDFISNVSHELKTPLAGIKALTETLQNGAINDPPAAHRFLERIEKEVDSLNLMVTELLELSRIESGRVPLELIPTRPIDVLRPAFERLHMQAERSGITLSMDCSEDLTEIIADGSRLQQVVVNLMHNAIKFTPNGGQVVVSASRSGKVIQFSVIDTGRGISSADLPRIFERFYKVDRSRSSIGTGLGLAIARHLVESHNGKIWAESIIGQGSKFFFTIPIA